MKDASPHSVAKWHRCSDGEPASQELILLDSGVDLWASITVPGLFFRFTKGQWHSTWVKRIGR